MYKIALYEKIIEKLKIELSKDYNESFKRALNERIVFNEQLIEQEKRSMIKSA